MMKRKRQSEDREDPDRWVVSYADFVTLLFAFFTTLYAISHVDLAKLARFSGSMKSAFKAAGRDAVSTPVIDGIRPVDYADVSLERNAREELGKFSLTEGVVITRDDRGVVASLGDEVLFASGSADLKPAARPLLSAVGSLVRTSGRRIVIEGHTDTVPAADTRYASNIELSAARAATVYAWLTKEEGIDPGRMSASGYGGYRPVASNATPEGRARNRRVDIIFVSTAD